MASIKVGDTLPEGTFMYVPYTPELADGSACGRPIKYRTSEWKDKKVVLFAVPGAFTPTCHVNHLPDFITRRKEFTDKKVDVVACLAYNDAFVMSGWGRVSGGKDEVLMLSDENGDWSSQMGLRIDGAQRTKRYAMIIDDLVVKSIEVESNPSGLEVSGAEHVLSRL
ncbi:Redoxin [Clavulina sp. PMI_390]|nr:Redoxin [Clavulina sp. PMI_390]